MNKENVAFNLKFLAGGGEMGELTRKKDWSKTPVGPPETWPQSLRTTLSIILNSKFPMFLWWGPELTCFYNDAYRPSLGENGKHPFILGQNAQDAWPEIWTIIKPLIDQVLAGGEATWSENQLIPIYRNGTLEDVYWTFSYSPVKDELDNVAGVLVTCSETTSKVKELKLLEASNKRYFSNIMQAPIAMCILSGKDHVVEIANELMLDIWGKTAGEMLNKPVFEGLPEAKDQGLEQLLDRVFETGEKFVASERPVNLLHNGKIETIYQNFTYEALREPDGTISGVVAISYNVTPQVLERKKTQENEQKLNMVIDASELGTWELDLETKKVIYSDRYLEIFGYKNAIKLTHDQLLNHLHPDDHHLRDEAFKRAFETGIFNYQARVIRKDKSIHWFESKGKVIYDQENKPVKMIGTIRDITEEKNYRQVLQEREQKFRLLADSMPQFVWTSDAEGNLNYFNKSVYNYSGLTSEQVDKDWLQIIHPDEREENVKQWQQSIKTGEVFIFEHRFKRYDGEYRWQLSRAIPQRDEQGNISMWVGTSTDIQDQKLFAHELEKEVEARTRDLKKLNEDLVKSEARYHLMIDEVQDYAIIYLNANGDIENWNKGAEKIKGYKAEEIIGKHFSVFYTEQDQKANTPRKLLNLALTSGKTTQEGWRVRKDGTYFWASIVITAIHDEKSNVIGFSKVTHDLTEKKQASDQLKINAEQLEQKNKELEKMNAELQSFAYVSSHDLQEPLRKIQTFATRILEKEHQNLSESGKDYFGRMQKAANRMQMLIEDLLDYSRTNTTERIFKSVDINEIINDVKNEFKDTIVEKNAFIEADLPQKVTVIPFQFRQLIHNLIGNSLKFAKPDIAPHIIFKGEIAEGHKLGNTTFITNKPYFHLTVSDNGIGFESQYKDRIFEVFQRLHGKAEYKGTGIGLAIVKKIVENHNGVITAEGKINKGATFDIYIPM